ncbi:unnamed protein product [Didymodactylos carnosus]|uniref:Nudix hydrolase domain-containing protein n=1 Tax=Didymodactylos carnosus TaxID=1234261 RepID=A0A816A2N1_9BILA|nr:unnamed protein product [Didymodactylos carnosus]CAF1590543.1 unnamed protein product [Didymodactylos carnosus]CAF3518567.1 unnamed protein product [Didymodactylos carnosus]CAF4462284.1 unnamed protein product [Didymodactylos carnosus]
MSSKPQLHKKALTSPYVSTTDIIRTDVSGKISWDEEWLDYCPIEYTAQIVFNSATKAQPEWADDPDPQSVKGFNRRDGEIDRRSHIGTYEVDLKYKDQPDITYPRNPVGRTGMRGRGLLGRWGPNHAADPIVTRLSKVAGKGVVLEFIGIKRKDTGEIALPGGMVDLGEPISVTLRREFEEECLNSLETAPHLRQNIDALMREQRPIYKGYVDDPRNTDNSWMETEAVEFFDKNGDLTRDLKLEAGFP